MMLPIMGLVRRSLRSERLIRETVAIRADLRERSIVLVSFTSAHFKTLTLSNSFCGVPTRFERVTLCLRGARARQCHDQGASPSNGFYQRMSVLVVAPPCNQVGKTPGICLQGFSFGVEL